MPKPYADDTIRCVRCNSPLQYNRFRREWVAIESYPEANSRCWNKRTEVFSHDPKGDVGRLLRAVRRWENRKLRVD